MSRPTKVDVDHLRKAASAVRARAYAPYSRYTVGAAILTRSGGLHVGCNFENATYGATICAERNAIGAMVAAGDRSPVACVVVTGGPKPGSPCGICRQVLAEFARDMKIVMVAEDRPGHAAATQVRRLADLLPMAFRLRPPPR